MVGDPKSRQDRIKSGPSIGVRLMLTATGQMPIPTLMRRVVPHTEVNTEMPSAEVVARRSIVRYPRFSLRSQGAESPLVVQEGGKLPLLAGNYRSWLEKSNAFVDFAILGWLSSGAGSTVNTVERSGKRPRVVVQTQLLTRPLRSSRHKTSGSMVPLLLRVCREGIK